MASVYAFARCSCGHTTPEFRGVAGGRKADKALGEHILGECLKFPVNLLAPSQLHVPSEGTGVWWVLRERSAEGRTPLPKQVRFLRTREAALAGKCCPDGHEQYPKDDGRIYCIGCRHYCS